MKAINFENYVNTDNNKFTSITLNSVDESMKPVTSKSSTIDSVIMLNSNDEEKTQQISQSIIHTTNLNIHSNRTWQGLRKLPLESLSELEKKIILNDISLINEQIMTKFTSVVQNLTSFLPYETLILQKPDKIKPVPENLCHVLIIHGPGHWISTYYDTRTL